MEKEAANQKTKKIRHSLSPRDLNLGQSKKKKEAPNPKNKIKTSQPKPDGLKTKAIKQKNKPPIKKKIHHSLNPTDLNQRQ